MTRPAVFLHIIPGSPEEIVVEVNHYDHAVTTACWIRLSPVLTDKGHRLIISVENRVGDVEVVSEST